MAFVAQVAAGTAPATGPSPVAHLRRVDVFSGPRARATLDEGWNSNCRGKAWSVNAEDKTEKLRFSPERFNREKTKYSGIGGQAGSTTTGKNNSPCRILGSLGAASGALESHQLKGRDRDPFLLSPNAQTALGFAKNLAKGACSPPERAKWSYVGAVGLASS